MDVHGVPALRPRRLIEGANFRLLQSCPTVHDDVVNGYVSPPAAARDYGAADAASLVCPHCGRAG